MSSIRDVSRVAGVSIATVSRALRTPEKVSKESLEKVHRAVEEVDYRPNLLARNFRTSQSFSVLVIVPNIANPFFGRVLQGIEEVAADHGYAVLLGDVRGSQTRAREYAALGSSRLVDGIIHLSHRIDPVFLPSDAPGAPRMPPIVNACECMADAPWPTVEIDNVKAADTATTYLISLGHKHVGVILGPKDSPVTRDRLKGYRNALARSGLTFDDRLTAQGDFSMESGRDAVPQLLRLADRPTALFCFSDEMAVGAMQALRRNGLEVPDDISVVGFDDVAFASFATPALTTVAQPAKEIGRVAMNRLFDVITGDAEPVHSTVLPTEFIIRDSTGPAPVGRDTSKR